MTYEQYWHGDVWMVVAFREADKRRMERMNYELWLQGLYFYEALCDASPIFHAFAKSGTKAIPYRSEPYELFRREKTQDKSEKAEEQERIMAKLFMKKMMRAGRDWGKK